MAGPVDVRRPRQIGPSRAFFAYRALPGGESISARHAL